MHLRQQVKHMLCRAWLVLVVVREGKVFVFLVVFFVVVVFRIMQLYKTHYADIFLMASDVVEKMMEKCAHFEEGLHSLIARRTGHQNLEGKKDGQKFFHFGGKVTSLWLSVLYQYGCQF